ncbi:MAG: hypothetical protein COZ69_01825 [Deltaproteobacteria bacterium CG_4_8_14_3_um_filter_45_9]|nr:MAG: hypothetical protein COS40_08090 [Deltaproteobacteria bacterium CG03_land_8_20_14_0_80_45_14]PIX25954.1 MAG: hypothetical protein COZ69_01825 [Deltaproteobacteria bacterium CG_4_8_14_3_um_filter_45_9]
MKMRFLLVLERLESILKRYRPKSFSAGPPTPLDLAFPWISITGKKDPYIPRGIIEILNRI